MQESIFNLFGSHHSSVQKHNSGQQAKSVSSVNSLGVGLAGTAHLKLKSASVGGPTPLKRALGDVSNRPQQSRPPPSKDENQKPVSFGCQHRSPSLSNTSKTVLQKPSHKSDESGLKHLTPELKHLTLSAGVDSMVAVEWNDKPEVFPDPEITKVEDDFEDFFPKRERLTSENIRFMTSVWKAEIKNIDPPKKISWEPFVDVIVKDLQPLEVDLLTGIAVEQPSLPDLVWDIKDEIYDYEDFFSKREQLTSENLRSMTSVWKAVIPNIDPPKQISWQPYVDVIVKDLQPLEVDLLTGIAVEQPSLPDLVWNIKDEICTQ